MIMMTVGVNGSNFDIDSYGYSLADPGRAPITGLLVHGYVGGEVFSG